MPDPLPSSQLGGFSPSPLLLEALDHHLSFKNGDSVAVALSGGADSAMLAVHAHLWASRRKVTLHFFHIHHGLQALADQWQWHVHDLAARLQRPCHSLRVQVQSRSLSADGMESAARDARYQGLAELAQFAGLQHVLLAHHQDDQAETVLMRLLRGTGITGLGAMAPHMQRDHLDYWRPWLDQPRSRILQASHDFALATGWHAVQDPTNINPDYTRGAVRDLLTPVLDARWPGWQGRLQRQAQLSRETQDVLDSVAGQDWLTLQADETGRSFSLSAWRQLEPARQSMVIRYWLQEQGAGLPTQARLAELLRQLRSVHAQGHDRNLIWKHGQNLIRCVRGRVQIESVDSISQKDGLKTDQASK
ncbi:tRNA lysidine(34) synthetase TilS [Alcaligenes faecalis subsp. parafaecalis]|uniref:tRNA(Ile)-lysidine synthase n=2 Tax=Alcaligenes parafaecalis TaxID=171260 RepID=A0ABT3VPA9_9BURK|nr:tRNA lysidine(34) synthetase TilS [Alcaligenes parafaecalis]MCX5464907.1 tRNA lysidine(34) synthetase TilS [Alcaligenes parafaecalis]